MSAADPCVARGPRPAPGTPTARIALLGTGTVGRAVLQRLARLQAGTTGGLALVYAANSRTAVRGVEPLCPVAVATALAGDVADDRDRAAAGGAEAARGRDASTVLSRSGDRPVRRTAAAVLPVTPGLRDVGDVLHAGRGARILIDATASDAVAERHAHWLARGIHVVTACKLGQGTALSRWRAIQEACASGRTRYGDGATVGAGLPMLRTLRELRAGGDRIHGIAGVLSGSLAWLFAEYDGLRPFSGFVREARSAGYTEPDPREDLSGEDVRRKLLILARAAGFALEAGDVEVESLVPPALAAVPKEGIDAALGLLDAPLRARFAAAYRTGATLRFVARLTLDTGRVRARVGLEALPAGDVLAGGAGTDNRVAFWSDRYAARPVLLQGPGAGAGVTAAGLLDDVLRIARGQG